MGWYGKPLGNRSLEEYLREHVTGEVVDIEVMPTDGLADYQAEAYLAVRRGRGVEGLVVLCRYNREGEGEEIFEGRVRPASEGWIFKEVEEVSGPFAARCPQRIVDQLTDPAVLYPDSESCRQAARKWRLGETEE